MTKNMGRKVEKCTCPENPSHADKYKCPLHNPFNIALDWKLRGL